MSILPDVFLKYQKELMRSVSLHAVTVVEKSRRTGYSWAAAAIAALTASSSRQAGGQDVFYMGYNLDMAREFIDYVADWARQLTPAAVEVEEYIFHDPDKPDKDIKAFRVEFASGFKVVALPSVPRALRGMQGLVIIDEAAFHDNLSELLKAAFALLIWGGKVLIISTHNGDDNEFNTLVNDIRGGRKPYNILRCTFDEALADGLFKRVCLTTGETWSEETQAAWRTGIYAFYGSDADEELNCIPSKGTGAAISSILVESRMSADAPVLRFECSDDFVHLPEAVRERETLAWCKENLDPVLKALDPSERHCLGGDFGRIIDLSVFWPLAIRTDLTRRTPFTVELRNVPFRQQEQILFYIVDRLPRFFAGKLDARGNGQYLAEVAAQRYGSMFEQVMLTEGWYLENMPPLKTAIEDGSILLPKDDGVSSDFRALRKVRGIIRVVDRSADDKGGKRHGDAAIACALSYAASRSDPVEYSFELIPVTQPEPGSMSMRPNPHEDDFFPDERWGGAI